MRLPTIFGWHEETEQMPEDSTDDYIVASFSQEHKKNVLDLLENCITSTNNNTDAVIEAMYTRDIINHLNFMSHNVVEPGDVISAYEEQWKKHHGEVRMDLLHKAFLHVKRINEGEEE